MRPLSSASCLSTRSKGADSPHSCSLPASSGLPFLTGTHAPGGELSRSPSLGQDGEGSWYSLGGRKHSATPAWHSSALGPHPCPTHGSVTLKSTRLTHLNSQGEVPLVGSHSTHPRQASSPSSGQGRACEHRKDPRGTQMDGQPVLHVKKQPSIELKLKGGSGAGSWLSY